MVRQSSHHPFHESQGACRGLSGARGGEARDTQALGPGVPSFLSADPPRSEGEALLRRIFSRTGSM